MNKQLLVISFFAISKLCVAQISQLWSFKTEGQIVANVVTNDTNAFIGSADGNLYALNKTNGKQTWVQTLGGTKFSSACVQDQDLFIASNSGTLYSIIANSGSINWHFTSKGEQKKDLWDYYLSDPKIHNNTIYWGCGDSCLYAINMLSGHKKWHFKSSGIIHANPLIAENTVYISSFDGHLYALNADNGQVIWKFKTLGSQYFPNGAIPKAPTLHNNILYFGSRDYNLYALDAKTGQCLWNYREPNGWIIASPLVYKDHLYFGLSDGHKMICMNAKTGTIKWEYPLNMRVFGEAIIHKNILIFGSHNGVLYAINPHNGKTISEFRTQGNIANYDKVFNEKDQFRSDFQLYGTDMKASEEQILNMGSILSTPHVDNNFIYISSTDGHVYALELNIP